MKEKPGDKLVSLKVKLPVPLHRQVKGFGILRGMTIQQVVVDALEKWVEAQGITVPDM